tara:strand:- start:885 stop:1646 length:762 start_codon:yes stop_codon:yes gene_type:complete
MADQMIDDVLDVSNKPNVLDVQEPTFTENVDEMVENEMDWEIEAKKFQSIADKRQAELDSVAQKLADTKQFEQLGNYLQDNPELVQKMQEWIVSGGQEGTSSQNSALSYDEFNPWDAYYKPESESYKFRMSQEHKLVGEAVQQQMTQIQQESALRNFVGELKGVHKLNDEEVGEFLDFVAQPKDKIDTNSLIKLWKENSGKHVDSQNALDAVRKTKSGPQSAGATPSIGGVQKSDKDKVWESIVGAGSRSSVL